MSEKTAEEKLREELEGGLAAPAKPKSTRTAKAGVRAVRSGGSTKKSGKPETLGERVDSLMDDFEREIAESLGVGSSVRSKRPKKERASAELPAKRVRRREPLRTPAVERKRAEVSDLIAELTRPEAAPVVSKATVEEAERPEPVMSSVSIEGTVTPEPDTSPVAIEEPAREDVSPSAPIEEPEPPTPEPDSSPVPIEEPAQEDVSLSAPIEEPEPPTPEPDLSPVAIEEPAQEGVSLSAPIEEPEPPTPEQAEPPAPVAEPIQSEPTELPAHDDTQASELPVELLAEPEPDIPDEEFPDIPVIDAEEIASSPEQEAELPDIPVFSTEEETTDDITDLDDNIDEFTEEPDDAKAPQDFPPFADVVLNVDSEIPNIDEPEPEPDPDPESESSPLTVTMPESTRTAEDKLMADIAEAMTGSPLSLETHDPSEPYRLPENFFTADGDSSSPQSAEEKLRANIAQAMSESPIGIAQDNANQNLEDDLNPFEQMPVPEPTPTPDFDDELVLDELSPDEEEDDEQPFLPDFSAEQEKVEEDINTDDLPDPFAMNELEQEEEDIAVEDDSEPEPELDAEPEPDIEPVSLEKDPDLALASDPLPLAPNPSQVTAEERFAQELAGFVQQDSLSVPDAPEPEPEPEPAPAPEPEPEQSLLESEGAPDVDIEDDDDFMASWGNEAASAMNFVDEEAEAQAQAEAPVPELEPEPEPEPAPAPTPTPAPVPAPAPAQPQTEPKDSQPSKWVHIASQVLLGTLLLLGIGALFILHSLTGRIRSGYSPSAPASYTYAVDRVNDADISARMRLRGIEGWKLVGSQRTQDPLTGNFGYEFIFVRRTPSNP